MKPAFMYSGVSFWTKVRMVYFVGSVLAVQRQCILQAQIISDQGFHKAQVAAGAR